jgi:hypothetical protein
MPEPIEKYPGTHCATIEEIGEEMTFFSEVLHCYDTCFALLRRTRIIYTIAEITELQGAFNYLKILWPTQRSWEQKEASVTPKSHNLWLDVIPQLAYLGRFFHFMEDPIRKLHKLDKLSDAVYCHIQNYQFQEVGNRNKKPLPGMSKFVNILSKCSRTESGSLLLQPSQREKTRQRGAMLSRENGGHSE